MFEIKTMHVVMLPINFWIFFLVLRPQEIKDVLRRCDAQKVWSDNAINVMAQEAHHHFTNGESIDFDKFRALPRKPNSSNAGFHQQEGWFVVIIKRRIL